MITKSVADPHQALNILENDGEFDLAVIEAQLPGMDGFTLAAEIHQLPRMTTMPLVVLMPLGVRQEAPSTAPIPFLTFAVKPIKPSQFFETLTRALTKSTPQKPEPPAEVRQTTFARRQPLRILLCDDNSINQKVAARIVQQLGYEPDLAANGREALEALSQKPYDLIFMDVMMPEMDGLEATRAIRKLQQKGEMEHFKSRIVIVAMTAQAMQGDREKCLEAGMDDYLAKPVRPTDVRAIIERWAAELNQPISTPSAAPPAAAVSANGDESPVEMERLLDLGGGSAESLRELVELYIQQTTGQLAQLETAVRTNQPEMVRHVAHSCAGASATLGMKHLVPVLRELERQGKSGQLVNADQLHAEAVREFKRTQDFLAKHSVLAATAEATIQS